MTQKLALIGFGAIGQTLFRALAAGLPAVQVGAILVRSGPSAPPPEGTLIFFDGDQLLGWGPSLAVECAGHGAVHSIVPRLLAAGVDVIVASAGALADRGLEEKLARAAATGGGRLLIPSGAVGGLDALGAAGAECESVRYTGRKPPGAWAGSVGSGLHNGLEVVFFEGSAREAALLYPKNANVAAAIALAGVGFDATRVRLIVDPGVSRNVHEIVATGSFGRIDVRLENAPLWENPRTSRLAALSLAYEVRRSLERAGTGF